MTRLPRKPRGRTIGSGYGNGVLGERSVTSVGASRPRASRTHRYAEALRRKPTPAEKCFREFLRTFNGGTLLPQAIFQWPFRYQGSRWILDYYLRELRIGVEIDGDYHRGMGQCRKDAAKTRDAEAHGITVIRFTNGEVFGDRAALEQKWRAGLVRAIVRSRAAKPNAASSGLTKA